LFDIVIKHEKNLKGVEEPVEFEIFPSDYLSSLPLYKKMEALQESLKQIKLEVESLENPSSQMPEGIGFSSMFKIEKGHVDKASANEWLRVNIAIIQILIEGYSEEA
jgi:hypothetical protein